MKLNLANSNKNGLAEITAMEEKLEELGVEQVGMSPKYQVQVMNDCLKIIFEAKPEELPGLIKEMRDYLCVDESPLQSYGAVSR